MPTVNEILSDPLATGDSLFPLAPPGLGDAGVGQDVPLVPVAFGNQEAEADETEIVDLSQVPVGTVMSKGTMQSNGLCALDTPLTGVNAAESDAWMFALEVDESCPLVLTESCHGLDCLVEDAPVESGTTEIPETTNAMAAAVATCTGSRSPTAKTWTIGYGGSNDVLTRNVLQITFTHHCTGGNPTITYVSGYCEWASWNNWKNDQCYYYQNAGPTTCGTCGPGVQYGIRGDYHCDFNGNFCSFTDWRHTLKASVDGYNDGNAWCTWSFSGNIPPKGHYDSAYNKNSCVG